MNEIQMFPMTFALLFAFVIISWCGFNHRGFMSKNLFNPYIIRERNEWYRFVTSGFIHQDFMHLFFNGFVWYQFGRLMEIQLDAFVPGLGSLLLLVLFLSGVIISHLTGYLRNKDNPNYASLGASGGVSSVLFAFILTNPTKPLGYLFLPNIDIPAFLIGIGYLWYSYYLAKKGSNDNVNHEAHYYGAVWGILFIVCVDYTLFIGFIRQVLEWCASIL